jgi:hypothetical protein
MAGVRGTEIVSVPLEIAGGGARSVDDALYDAARTFFG